MYINVKRKNNYDDYEVTIRARFDTCAGAMGFIGRVESVEFEMPLPDKNEPYGRYRDDHVRVAVLAVAKSGEKARVSAMQQTTLLPILRSTGTTLVNNNNRQ
jgi:hypothetical protein